ncbi:MAG: transposase [Alphaproteobacteria bacterium]|nr:transposase [Alphaproteobacteria bacterium]
MSAHLSDALVETLSAHLDLGKSRLLTLSWLIIGLVNARTVNLSHLAAQCAGDAKVSSSYRRVQRFFQFVSLDGDWLAQAVIKLLKLKAPWTLCIDRTNWSIGRLEVNILMLAIATRRFRIPLMSRSATASRRRSGLPCPTFGAVLLQAGMWTILDKAGSSNQEERIALMRRYPSLFGAASIVWLLADREFIGARWLRFLLDNDVTFAVRLKDNSRVCLDDGRHYQLKSLLRKRSSFKRLRQRQGRLITMDEDPGLPLYFAAKRLKNGEMLINATNGPAKNALNADRRRWQIECLFGDSKTRGLNMEDTRLTLPRKLDTLLIIVTLGMAWAYASATAVMGTTSIKTKTHGYRAQSWFRLGFDHLRKWILHQQNQAADVWNRIWPKRKSTLKFHSVV